MDVSVSWSCLEALTAQFQFLLEDIIRWQNQTILTMRSLVFKRISYEQLLDDTCLHCVNVSSTSHFSIIIIIELTVCACGGGGLIITHLIICRSFF